MFIIKKLYAQLPVAQVMHRVTLIKAKHSCLRIDIVTCIRYPLKEERTQHESPSPAQLAALKEKQIVKLLQGTTPLGWLQ